MIILRETKDFDPIGLAGLFHSVGWDTDTPPEKLANGLKNSTNIISAWDGDKLVGVIRSMDDGCWSANIDCLVVHADYHHKGIGTALLKALLEKIGDILNISVSPNERENISFYEKFGFESVEGSSLLQIVRKTKM